MHRSESLRLQFTALAILIGAAALGYLSDFLLTLMFNDLGWTGGVLGILGATPFVAIVALIQDYAFLVRDGKAAFFRDLTGYQRTVTSISILAVSTMLWLIPLAAQRVTSTPERSFMSFLVLMLASYAGTLVIRFFRTHPLRGD